ncbi:MAG: alpha/beta hydrolase-fold protein [Myxococcota bacterium]
MRATMRRSPALLLVVAAACATPERPGGDAHVATAGAFAQPWYRRPLPAGVETLGGLRALVVAPPTCRSRACPTLVVLPGGAQNENLAGATLRPWAQALHDEGWVAAAPIAPSRDRAFYEGDVSALGPFLDALAEAHPPEGGRFSLVGVSNGGIAAFTLAAAHPERFGAVAVAPGYARPEVPLAALRSLAITSFVGTLDAWRHPAETTHRDLREAGVASALRLVAGVGHVLAGHLEWRTLRVALTAPGSG